MANTTQRALVQGSSTLAIGCLSLFSSVFPNVADAAQAQANQSQDSQSQANLGGVTVTDTAIDEGSYKVDRMSSPKATAPLVDTPKSITVISRQVLEDTNSTTLSEALRTVPGITMGAGEGGNPLGDRPFIRGSDSQASTYMDGVRDIAAQTRETFDVDAIEVTKGSDSVTNGSGNGGGSINIVSKAPQAKRFVKVDGSLGNADYKRVTVDVNQPINDFIGVRVNGMYHDQGVAGRDAIWQKRWGIAPTIKFGMSGPTSLTLGWYHMHSTELPDTGIPYATTISNQTTANAQTAPLSTSPFTTAQGNTITRNRGAFYGLADRDFRTTNTDELTAAFEHNFESGLKLRNTARYTNTTQEYIYTQPDDRRAMCTTPAPCGAGLTPATASRPAMSIRSTCRASSTPACCITALPARWSTAGRPRAMAHSCRTRPPARRCRPVRPSARAATPRPWRNITAPAPRRPIRAMHGPARSAIRTAPPPPSSVACPPR
jgi:catecholate siderophore receptor